MGKTPKPVSAWTPVAGYVPEGTNPQVGRDVFMINQWDCTYKGFLADNGRWYTEDRQEVFSVVGWMYPPPFLIEPRSQPGDATSTQTEKQ